MKKYFFVLILIFAIINVACSDEPPSVRVKNERTSKANVQIKQSDGNTINLNDVSGGTITPYRDIAEGSTQATAVIQNETVSPSYTFSASENRNYTVVVENTNPPKLRVDSEDK